MTVATLAAATSAENRKAVVAGTIGNVLEWYDFGVYGYLATTMSQLFFPGEDKTISLLKAFARLRRRLRHAAGRLDPIRHLWRSFRQTLGLERGYLSHGIFDRGDRVIADLRPSWGAGTQPARCLQALAGAFCWRRVGRIDLLHRGIRTGRTARFHWFLATGQRRLRLPAWFPERRAPQLDPFARSVHVLGVESPVPPRHSGRHSRRLPPLGAQGNAQVH